MFFTLKQNYAQIGSVTFTAIAKKKNEAKKWRKQHKHSDHSAPYSFLRTIENEWNWRSYLNHETGVMKPYHSILFFSRKFRKKRLFTNAHGFSNINSHFEWFSNAFSDFEFIRPEIVWTNYLNVFNFWRIERIHDLAANTEQLSVNKLTPLLPAYEIVVGELNDELLFEMKRSNRTTKCFRPTHT